MGGKKCIFAPEQQYRKFRSEFCIYRFFFAIQNFNHYTEFENAKFCIVAVKQQYRIFRSEFCIYRTFFATLYKNNYELFHLWLMFLPRIFFGKVHSLVVCIISTNIWPTSGSHEKYICLNISIQNLHVQPAVDWTFFVHI